MAVAVVVVEAWKRPFKIVRLTIGARLSVNFVANLGINFLGPLDVIADEQIQLAIVVIIHPRRAGAPVIR